MKINEIEISIEKGDIALVKAEAYVIPQFRDTTALTGVSARILHTDSYRGIEDYRFIARYMNFPFGYAISSPTMGKQVARIINCAILGVPKESAFHLVQLAVFSALKEAERHGIAEIAIPPLGTGASEPLSFSRSAKAMLSAIAVFKGDGIVQKITIPIFKSDKAYRQFKDGVAKYHRDLPDNLEQEWLNLSQQMATAMA